MSTARKKTGRIGEELAARYLEEQGYVVLERNYRCPVGEMDIVSQDGDCIAFVEVRTRCGRNYGTPEESITPAKKDKLIRVARTYLQDKGLSDVDWRIDVAAIEMTTRGRVQRLELIRNAVTGDDSSDDQGVGYLQGSQAR